MHLSYCLKGDIGFFAVLLISIRGVTIKAVHVCRYELIFLLEEFGGILHLKRGVLFHFVLIYLFII